MNTQNQTLYNKKQMQGDFGRAATSYAEYAGLQRYVAQKLSKLICAYPASPSVLDIGCGTGFLAEFTERPMLQMDISLGMCQQAQKQGKVFVADMDNLPVKNAVFDTIVSSLTLQWANDLPTTLNEIKRCLKPTGILVFSTLGNQTTQIDVARSNPFLSASEYKLWLEQAGFEAVIITSETILEEYDSAYHFAKQLKRIGANNKMYDRKQSLPRKILAAMKLTPIQVEWEVLYVSAKKTAQ